MWEFLAAGPINPSPPKPTVWSWTFPLANSIPFGGFQFYLLASSANVLRYQFPASRPFFAGRFFFHRRLISVPPFWPTPAAKFPSGIGPSTGAFFSLMWRVRASRPFLPPIPTIPLLRRHRRCPTTFFLSDFFFFNLGAFLLPLPIGAPPFFCPRRLSSQPDFLLKLSGLALRLGVREDPSRFPSSIG